MKLPANRATGIVTPLTTVYFGLLRVVVLVSVPDLAAEFERAESLADLVGLPDGGRALQIQLRRLADRWRLPARQRVVPDVGRVRRARAYNMTR